MTGYGELRKHLAEIRRELDRAQREREANLRGPGRSFPPDPDIITFATDPGYLNRRLFPRQATALKLMFLGRDLQGRNVFTDYDHEVIHGWIRAYEETGNEGVQPDIYERIDMNVAEGRHWFREVSMPIGRRGSKNFMGAIVGSYILNYFINLGDPHAHYGIDRTKRLAGLVFAGKRDQAKAQQWRDLAMFLRESPYFKKFVSRTQVDTITLYSNDQPRNESRTDMDDAIFEISARESTSLAGRGPATFMLIFDEIAHITPTTQADDLFESALPSLEQFHNEGFIFMPSSPWQKIGKQYERYELAFETDEETGKPAYPEMLVVQLPSWEIYEDWEKTGIGGLKMLPDRPGTPPQFFERKPQAVITYDEQMKRAERANPESFRVEYRGHFASIIDAYLPENRVNDIFNLGWQGKELVHKQQGILPAVDYHCHGDPSKSGANFGWAIAHVEMGEFQETGEMVEHIIFDVLHAWVPGDFDYNNFEIDYMAVEDDLKSYIDRFMPVRITFDQFNSIGFIQRLRQYVAMREFPKRISMWERTAQKALNWETYETFKNAVGLGLVRAPDFDLARHRTDLPPGCRGQGRAARHRPGHHQGRGRLHGDPDPRPDRREGRSAGRQATHLGAARYAGPRWREPVSDRLAHRRRAALLERPRWQRHGIRRAGAARPPEQVQPGRHLSPGRDLPAWPGPSLVQELNRRPRDGIARWAAKTGQMRPWSGELHDYLSGQ